ncbi:MAG: glycosyltransferase family 2 protein [Sedimentisphaerales bacterium]|nr:glycosyltransferase family 2 protein [Sedimentisphaerales bacterium]
MKLSILIVSWNVREDLFRCVRSIEKNEPSCTFEVIIVDNASTDETVDMIKKCFSQIKLITNHENRGFAVANNQAIEKSQGEYVLLLNPDTIVHPKSLDILVRFMDINKDIGACGPKLLNADGSNQDSVRCFPSFRGALHRHTAFKFLGIFKGQYRKWVMYDYNHDTQKDVDQVMGAALMVRRSVIEQVGVMDERFFMYYEEVDLCYRIKQTGWRIVYIPEAVITHLGGSSSAQIPVSKRIMVMTSLLKFFRKHRGIFATRLFSCVFKPAVILRDLIDIAAGTIKYVFSIVTADKKRRKKSAEKVKNSMILIRRYCSRCRLLKM